MELREIEKHAKALMTHHGVGYLEFQFDNGRKRLGSCLFRKCRDANGRMVRIPVRITLSKHYAVLLPVEEIEQTILHEIAHAKAGHAAGHGPVWAAIARSIGATGNRCASPSASPATSVAGYCPLCEKVVMNQHRLPLRVYYCTACRKAGRLTLGDKGKSLKWFRNGKHVPVHSMPQRFQEEYFGVGRFAR